MTEELWNATEVTDSNFKDRRANGRCCFVARAALVDLNSNSRLAARTADITRDGCYIDTLNPLLIGTAVALRLSKENQSFKVTAEVVYVRTGNGMGLAFAAAEPAQLQTLDQWIAEFDAAMAANTSKSRVAPCHPNWQPPHPNRSNGQEGPTDEKEEAMFFFVSHSHAYSEELAQRNRRHDALGKIGVA